MPGLSENTLFCDQCGAYVQAGVGAGTAPLGAHEVTVTRAEREKTIEVPEEEAISPVSLKLSILDSGREMELPLTKDEVNIGRLDTASNSFPEVDLTSDGGLKKGVSRWHAKIIRRGSEVFIEDLGSMNGTFLNRKKLTPYLPQVLKSGDELQLGKLMLRVSFTRMGQQCEDCREYKKNVFRRADIPRLLCSDCYAKALANNRPSKYMSVPSYKSSKATPHPLPSRRSDKEIQG
jgi:predicted component of type VI protein secretion system